MADYFTRAQAEALLPRLTAALREVQALRAELAAREMELREAHARVASNGHGLHTELETLPEEMADLTRRIADQAREIAESGALIKDLDIGLLDFPALREGREVYLCWRLGEPRIAWWHEIETGLSGRQSLEDDAE
ncbi:MAG: DUF2203 domain-containing protein [Chloroflexota bacterium]|nr:DUF2203 domain-containing protein [Chloroflexota bacterium]